MGQVYQAQDTKLQRIVAIKRMAPRLQQDADDRRKFLREAQQASALDHPSRAASPERPEAAAESALLGGAALSVCAGEPEFRLHRWSKTPDFSREAA